MEAILSSIINYMIGTEISEAVSVTKGGRLGDHCVYLLHYQDSETVWYSKNDPVKIFFAMGFRIHYLVDGKAN